MTDETDPRAPQAPPDPGATPDPAEPGTGTAPAVALPSVNTAQLTAFWTGLGSVGQLVLGAALAVIAITVVGAIIDAWDSSGTMSLIVVTAAVAAGLAAWLTARVHAGALLTPIPLETIEFAAGVVASVLAVLRLIEIVFEFDNLEDFGGPIGLVLTVGLAIAAVAILFGALRRDPTLRSAALAGDRGTWLAVGGLVAVVLAWLWNVSIGYWNLSGGATAVGLVSFGAVLVVVQDRWEPVIAEVPLGWVGAAFGLVSLLVGFGLWGQLMEIGLTQKDLEIVDYLPFVVWYLGTVAVIAGGVLAGMPSWQARLRPPAPVVATPPTTPPPPVAVAERPAPVTAAAPEPPPAAAAPDDPPGTNG
jgi:hypothetical protein